MAKPKVEIKCPYCDRTLNSTGYTSHIRSKHPEEFEAFVNDKAAFIAKNRVGAETPHAAPPEPATPAPEPTVEITTEKPTAAPVEKQKTGGFLSAINDALNAI